MKIIALKVKSGLFEKDFTFNTNINIIYSSKNGCGKTTLVRMLLYALGFNIPNTKNLKFEKLELILSLQHESLGNIKLIREHNIQIELHKDNKIQTFSLPSERLRLHKLIFNTTNEDILNNILGTFYIDQEKGWTLLNRGKVIGSIHFNIEELFRGLGNKDSSKLIQEKNNIINQINQYNQIFKISEYQKLIETEANELMTDFDSALINKLEILRIEYRRLKRDQKKLDQLLTDNKNFKKYIEEMKILVQINDLIFPLTSNNIVGYTDSIESIKSKLLFITNDINRISSQIKELEKSLPYKDDQGQLFITEKWTKSFNASLSKIPINKRAIEEHIRFLKAQQENINRKLKVLTRENNSAIVSFYKIIQEYAQKLQINLGTDIPLNYIFTSNLKELSGALLQKLVFAFKIGYILETEKALGIKLPIIIDSPTAKELDAQNVKLMLDILKNDFPNNQIIIASIYKYDFDDNNTTFIELNNKVLN